MRSSRLDLRRYGAVLRTPGAKPMVLGALISRQSAMLVLAQVLLVHQVTGSYAAAGAATAAFTLAQGLVAPIWGRMVDRRGPRLVVVGLALIDAVFIATLAWASILDVGAAALVVVAGAVGLFSPPTVPAMRTMWGRLLDQPLRLQGAYALETALTESAFVSGPLLAGAAAALFSPAAAVAIGGGLLVGGSLLFGLAAGAEPCHEGVRPASSARCLTSPAIRALVAAWVPLGASFAALEIVVPAFCQRAGATPLAGVILATTAAGSVLGSLCFGALSARSAPQRQFRLGCLGFSIALCPLVLASGVPALGALLLVAGLVAAPIAITTSQWIDEFAAPGTATESFTWVLTAYMLGAAVGVQGAGVALSDLGLGTALVTPSLFGMVAAICAPSWHLAVEARRCPSGGRAGSEVNRPS